MSDFIPDNQFKPDTPDPVPAASHTPDFVSDKDFTSDETKYAGASNTAKAFLAGKLRGGTLGISDYLAKKTGLVNPETLAGLQAAHPIASGIGNIAGGATLTMLGGIAAPIEGALASGLGNVGAKAVAYGAEGAVFGAGQTLSDYSLGDPNLNAEKVVSNIGLGALMGAGLGTLAGGAENYLHGRISGVADNLNSEAKTAQALSEKTGQEAGSLAASEDLTNGLKKNTPEILAASERLGLPLTEGMTSSNRWVQQAEDALSNGAPTYPAIRKRNIFQRGYDRVNDVLGEVLDTGDKYGGGAMTKAQLGESLNGSLSNKIEQESGPINEMYENLKTHTQNIEVPKPAISKTVDAILSMPEAKTSFAEGSLARGVAKDLLNIDSVDDLRNFSSSLNRSVGPTASAGERHMLGVLADKISDLEEHSIVTAAKSSGLPPEAQAEMRGLLDKMQEAKDAYRPFKENLKTLFEQLGKKNIAGAKTALNYLKDLDPEALANKLFDKKFSSFNKFFADKFPEEAALMRQYQKQTLRDVASKSGSFSPKVFFNEVNKLEPEVRSAIFGSDELSKIKDAETWIRSVPPSFNPSGTANMSAFREYFTNPKGAILGNLRDFGIEAFIKAMGSLPEDVRGNPFELGRDLADKFNKYNAVKTMAEQVDQKIEQNTRAIFSKSNAVRGGALSGLVNLGDSGFDRALKSVKNLADNPNGMLDHVAAHTEGMSNSLPNVSLGVTQTMISGVQFLNSKIPRGPQNLPLSQDWKPSHAQKVSFMRYYHAVNDPVSVLKDVKNGTLTNESMEALSAVQPRLLNQMRKQVIQSLSTHKSAKDLGYGSKISLSKFLGTPVDENMLPAVIQSNQMALSGPQRGSSSAINTGVRGGSRRGAMSKLNLSNGVATDTRRSERGED